MLAQTKQPLDAVRSGLFSVFTLIFKTHTFFCACLQATHNRKISDSTREVSCVVLGSREMKSTYFDVRHGGAMLLFFVKSEITKNSNRSVDLNNHPLLWLQKKPLQITQQI